MTHPADSDFLNTVRQLLSEQGPAGFAEGVRRLVNEALRLERAQALQARPYERTENRQGYANGFKDKTLTPRLGPITFDIPQVRSDLAFYPAALQKGLRSEQALKLALAEMYVPGVSTRKVAAIVEERGGTMGWGAHASRVRFSASRRKPRRTKFSSKNKSEGWTRDWARRPIPHAGRVRYHAHFGVRV